MANFTTVIGPLSNGEHVRRDGWGVGSTMYADENKQLKRTPTVYPHIAGSNKPEWKDYGWILDLNDINATDWQAVMPTSTSHHSHV